MEFYQGGRLLHISDKNRHIPLGGAGPSPKVAARHGHSNPTDIISHRRAKMHAAALKYAERGIPVFPLKPGEKKPLTPNGHLDATTDPRRIHAWWNRRPDANIGIPTGERSGILVLDEDTYRGGGESLDALTAEHGELPDTTTSKTGRGGRQRLFRYPAKPEIRNSTDRLGTGLDVRGEGGYIVAPPSITTGAYEWIDKSPLADPPEWLPKLLIEPQRAVSEDQRATPRSNPLLANLEGPIKEGSRNNTLTSIAGGLRARGLDQPTILKELMVVNETRCAPTLPENEVEGIARSISRYTPGNASPAVTTETLKVLDEIDAELLGEHEAWLYTGGKSERDVMVALVKIARRHGELIPCGGVRVSIGVRPLALAAAISKASLTRKNGTLDRLRRKGWLRRDAARRTGVEAGAFVLMPASNAMRARLTHSTTGGRADGKSGLTLRAPYSAPRLRWSAPRWDLIGDEYVRTTTRRMGKSAGQIVDILEYFGGAMKLEDLYACIYPYKNPKDRKRWRPRDLRRRVITRLEAAGVAECDEGDTVRLTAEWLDSLNRERDRASEIAAYQRDIKRYERERAAYREHRNTKPDVAPSQSEMDAHRTERELRTAADGLISELQPASNTEEVAEAKLDPVEPGSGMPELTESERRALEAIRAFECKFGPGSFRWTQADCKAMFYQVEPGVWPTPEELVQIRAYVEAAGGLEVAA